MLSALRILGEGGFSGTFVPVSTLTAALRHLFAIHNLPEVHAAKAAAELLRQDLALTTRVDNGISIQLTPKGLYRLQDGITAQIYIPSPEQWDGHWRMVMFDVPVRHNAKRTRFTTHLQRLRFMRLRDSTWVYPYPCFAQLEELTRHYQLQQYVTFAEISRFDNASLNRLRRHFDL